eukprot:scaffold11502_cov90-Isochrysis_galbana.AAC.1
MPEHVRPDLGLPSHMRPPALYRPHHAQRVHQTPPVGIQHPLRVAVRPRLETRLHQPQLSCPGHVLPRRPSFQ